MRTVYLCLLVCLCYFANAQLQQNIFFSNNASSENPIGAIDSITFNGSGDTLHINFFTMDAAHHSISEIDFINFSEIAQQLDTCALNEVLNYQLLYSTVTDLDANTYRTVLINNTEWMAENLRNSRYQNGDPIQKLFLNDAWTEATGGAYTWFDNDSAAFDCPYGKLYNWYAASDSRNICPVGWHVPSDVEWSELINFLDPSAEGGNAANSAGSKLKAIGLAYWATPNPDATNETGFSTISSGYRSSAEGSFLSLTYLAYFWSSNEANSYSAYERYLANNVGAAYRGTASKSEGFSVRCMRN